MQAAAYGFNALANGNGSVAIGDHAFSNGDPFSGNTRTEARGGVALALAASGLRYDDRPGKLSLAGAIGNFKGESGLALELGYAATNRLRFNASVSGVPHQGSVGGVVGGSIR